MEEEKKRIYRFKVKNALLFEEMKEFAYLHKFESKDVLKESFESWYISEDINRMIEEEESYLNRYSYNFGNNNMKNKIFKSIKYYFIKNILKSMNLESSNNTFENNTKETKKHTLKFSPKLIEQVKTHLNSSIIKNNFMPKKSYNEFIELYSEIIEEEKNNLIEIFGEETITKHFDIRMKKMFKNQYYVMNKDLK